MDGILSRLLTVCSTLYLQTCDYIDCCSGASRLPQRPEPVKQKKMNTVPVQQRDDEDPASASPRTWDTNARSLLGKRKFDRPSSAPGQESIFPAKSAMVNHALADVDMSDCSGDREQDEDIDATLFAPDIDEHDLWTDGIDDHTNIGKPAVAAIFIHAGAGYHSVANERLHLDACSEYMLHDSNNVGLCAD